MFLSESARKGLNMADEGLGLLFNPVTSILIYMSLSIDILGLIIIIQQHLLLDSTSSPSSGFLELTELSFAYYSRILSLLCWHDSAST